MKRIGEHRSRSIHEAFVCFPDCPYCGGCGHVCEEHPLEPWGGIAAEGCDCGAPGMPCRPDRRQG